MAAMTNQIVPGDCGFVSSEEEEDGHEQRKELRELRAELRKTRAQLAESRSELLESERRESLATELLEQLTKKDPSVPAPPRNIKDCLKWQDGGLYMYHFKNLIVRVVGRPNERWCVVKVGIADCINQRLSVERNDTNTYRAPLKLRITAEDLKGKKDIGELIGLFTGSLWNGRGSEEPVRTSMGLPLGKFIVGYDESKSAIQQIIDEHPQDIEGRSCLTNEGKLKAWAWNLYFKKGAGQGNERVTSCKVGPSELIMMPERAVKKLQRKFRENPAEFAEQAQDDMQKKKGPAWDCVRDAEQAIRDAFPSGWHEERVTVQFKRGVKEDGLIDPLVFKLGDDEKMKPPSELGVGARVELDGKAGEVVGKVGGWWKVRLEGEEKPRSARASKLTVLGKSNHEP
jgi:hypothetical protein